MEFCIFNPSSRMIFAKTAFRARGGTRYICIGQTQLINPRTITISGTQLVYPHTNSVGQTQLMHLDTDTDIDQGRTYYVDLWCAADVEKVVDLWLDEFAMETVVVNLGCSIVAVDSDSFPSAVDIWCIWYNSSANARETRRFLTTIHPQCPG